METMMFSIFSRKITRSLATLFSLGLSVSVSLGVNASSTNASPRTDAYGNWQSPIDNRAWAVVDPDPNGLNCRMRGSFGDIMFRYNGENIRPSVISMPVVRQIPYDTVVLVESIARSPTGRFPTDVLFFDDRGLPWLFTGDCFIRANEAFVVPMYQ